MQNIHKGICKLGWIIDWAKYYRYMKQRYAIDRLVMFIGYVETYVGLYNYLRDCGYEIVFKETMILKNQHIKGNVDIDVAIYAVDDRHIGLTNQFFLATGDGDYNSLVYYFVRKGAMGKVFTPGSQDTSSLLTKATGNSIVDLSNLEHILGK
ncbi:MAG: NYN domain-containing protein [Candidatus Absconditabacterales bacterium]